MNNKEIIEQYYRTHRDEVLAYAQARLHCVDEAEDVVQEAFLRLLTGNRLISEQTMSGLVYTLCRNLIVDRYRWHSVRLDATHDLSYSCGDTPSAESVLSVREINEQLERCLAKVSDESRTYFCMNVYCGLQVRDICELTGEQYNVVEYRLRQARKRVRTYLRHVV
jgi:RNA polymerase sigma-70 factor (ECF subfamily)